MDIADGVAAGISSLHRLGEHHMMLIKTELLITLCMGGNILILLLLSLHFRKCFDFNQDVVAHTLMRRIFKYLGFFNLRTMHIMLILVLFPLNLILILFEFCQ